MDEQPSTSGASKNKSKEPPPANPLPPELDIASDDFDPLRALYADPSVKLTKRKSKVIFQNMAALEIEYARRGIYGLSCKSKEKDLQKKPTALEAEAATTIRRFLPHQMAIPTTGEKLRNKRNLLKVIENMEGPMATLRDCMRNKKRIKVYTRSEHGVRGTITGYVISFDKHWNFLMRDVQETWKRRKYKYDENKFCGTPSDCREKLIELGIKVPETSVKSLNRKNVELSRCIPQMLIRGEQVVLVITAEKEVKETKAS